MLTHKKEISGFVSLGKEGKDALQEKVLGRLLVKKKEN